jgi:hypothetical protein
MLANPQSGQGCFLPVLPTSKRFVVKDEAVQ